MNHPTPLAHELHQEALQAVAQHLRAEAHLMNILQRIDHHRTYREFGYPSLFQYAVDALHLTESTTYNFINVARKARLIPALQQAIEEGTLSVSKARKIVPVLTQANQAEWITKAQTLSQKKLEKEVARVSPHAATPEKLTYLTDTRMSLTLGMSEKLAERLRRIQDLESQRRRTAATLEDVLETLATLYLERHDPLEKAKRAHSPVARQASKKIPAALRHAVAQRDLNQCTHLTPQGTRCPKTRWLDIHHVRPLSQGGTHELSNLTTLCSAHHRLLHENAAQAPQAANVAQEPGSANSAH
jgi:5-methylcytosine-specific restriction endonuclease McrA